MTTVAAHRRVRAGFTLVEILVVLAILALVTTLLLPGVNSVLRSMSEQAPDRMVWDAITAARARALEGNRTVWLRIDRETRRLSWDDGDPSAAREVPAGTSLQFLRPSAGARVLLGGVLVESEEIPGVRFHPDGTCDQFRIQLRQGTAPPVLLAVDPWTCAPVLRTVEK